VNITTTEIDDGTLAALGLIAADTPNVLDSAGGTPATVGAIADSTTALNNLANVATDLDNGDIIRFTGVKPDGAKFEGSFTFKPDANGNGTVETGEAFTVADLLKEIERSYGANVTASIDSGGRVALKETSTGNPITGFTINLSLDDSTQLFGNKTSAIFGDKPPFEFNLNGIVHDSKGDSHSLTVTFTKRPEANQWTWVTTIDGITPSSGGAGLAAFNADGTLKSFGAADNQLLTFTPPGGAETITIEIKASKSGEFAGLTQLATTSSAGIVSRDGRGAGRLDTINVDKSGTVIGRFTNGVSQTLGQIMLADFNNPPGLTKLGNSIFGESDSSGEAIIGIGGETINGNITAGALELSNVDLSQEFTDFIIAQRGFQANARVITTTDDLMGEVVNLKR
jgi:flagellar hook-basal body protein